MIKYLKYMNKIHKTCIQIYLIQKIIAANSETDKTRNKIKKHTAITASNEVCATSYGITR